MGECFVWQFYRTPSRYYSTEWVFWFRIFGRGLHFSDRPRSDVSFSELFGYTKAHYIFGVRIAYLAKPEPLQ